MGVRSYGAAEEYCSNYEKFQDFRGPHTLARSRYHVQNTAQQNTARLGQYNAHSYCAHTSRLLLLHSWHRTPRLRFKYSPSATNGAYHPALIHQFPYHPALANPSYSALVTYALDAVPSMSATSSVGVSLSHRIASSYRASIVQHATA